MLHLYYKILDFIYKRKLASTVSLGNRSSIAYRKISMLEACSVNVGDDSQIAASITFERPNAFVEIGTRTFIGNSTLISSCGITIGDDVLISWGCTIVDHDSHSIIWNERSQDVLLWAKGLKDWSNVNTAHVTIGNKVWIGFNVTILKGVTIGEGAVVAAGSVVTKNVEPYTTVAGNPVRVISQS